MRNIVKPSGRLKAIFVSATALSIMVAPAVIYADASNPAVDRPKVMKKKARAKVQRPVRAQAKPQMQAPEPVQEVVTVAEPAPVPMPEPVAAPEPVAVAQQSAPVTQAPVVAKSGGNSLLGFGIAAVIAGIVVAVDSGKSSASPS
jgi:hypothetical protein